MVLVIFMAKYLIQCWNHRNSDVLEQIPQLESAHLRLSSNSVFSRALFSCFVAKLDLTLCDPMDYSLPGFSLLGIYFPSKNTKVGYHFLLQRIFLTQGSNLCLMH